MMENLVKVWPLVLSLLSCTVNPAVVDLGGFQVRCRGEETCYPFIALLMNLHGICTAAIVSRNWMVSAASCCKKPGGRTFLAYAGNRDVMVAERLQVRTAQAVMWADPESGSVTQVATENSSVVLLLTSIPWAYTRNVHPIGIGDIPPYPRVLQESLCITAGFNLDKKLAVRPCNASAYWNPGGQTCHDDEGSCMFAMAPGSLLYCYVPDIVVGVSLGNGDSLPNTKDGRLKTCFANLGGAVMSKLQEIAYNESLAYDLRVSTSSVHRKDAYQVGTFRLATKTATQLHNKSNLDHSKINEGRKDVVKYSFVRRRVVDENEKVGTFRLATKIATQLRNKSNLDHFKINEGRKDVVKDSFVRKRDVDENGMIGTFRLATKTATQLRNISNLDHFKINEGRKDVVKGSFVRKRVVDENEKGDVPKYARSYTATPAEVMWSMVFLLGLVGCLLLIYWKSVRKLVICLYRYAWRKSASRNYQSVY